MPDLIRHPGYVPVDWIGVLFHFAYLRISLGLVRNDGL